MIIAQIPRSEDIRLADLQLYDILYTAEEQEFDELRELAAQICNCPISLITLIDKDRQWFKSKQGVDESETSRDDAFCSHAILQNDVMVVEDATKDKRFSANRFVTGDMNVRFYAGAPIVSPTGQNLGTICVLNTEPGKLTPQQERGLEILSSQVSKLLELRLKSKLIEERASELMNIKNNAVQHLLKEQDMEKLSFAKELHENIAQELVASRMYLGLATSSEKNRLQHIQFANDSIANALTEIKNLSYSISPTTLESSDIHVMMENLLHEQAPDLPFQVDFVLEGRTTAINFAQAMNCVKITESWLQVLKTQPEISTVHIRLHIDQDIQLSIEDDATERYIKERERNVINSMVYDRVISMNGTIQFSEPKQDTNLLSANFPLMESNASVEVNP